MAITLADHAAQETEPLRKGILANLLRKSDVMGVIPIENVSAFDSILTRWKDMPTVAFRNLNEGYSEGTGTTEQITESIYFFGGDIQIDRQFKNVTNLIEPHEVTQTKMKTAAMAFKFNDMFINGDHISDPKSFEGLKKRLANMPSRQTILATAAGATVLPVLKDADNKRRFLAELNRLLTLVEGGATHLFMNSTTLWGLETALHGSTLLTTTKDAFDREFTSYRGVLLVDVGLKSDKSTEVITNTETAADGGSDSTSIYAVNMNVGEGCHGIQLNDLDVYDPLKGAEKESGPQTLLRIDWGFGLANWSDYSIARLYNFGMVYA